MTSFAWTNNHEHGPNDAVAVPEPGSLLLLTFGLIVFASRRR
jgi:hypothetical protein